ncbi:MAG: ABC transporter substrate-binding protein [Gaiellaceae bacterium]
MRARIRVTMLAVAVAAAAASTASAAPAQKSDEQLLRVASTAAVTTWDPVKSFSTEVAYMANIYEPLLYAQANGTFRPALATSWSHSTNGKTWTFRLRKGVTFHDGEPLTSAAVKQSIEAVVKRGGAAFIWSGLKSIATPNDSTVVFHMKTPSRVDLIASSENGAWIVCPEALAAVAKDPNYFESGKDCGTGPYTLKSYKAGSQVVLSAYDKYWGGWSGNRYQNVAVEITPEAIVEQQMLTSGQVDLALSVPLENVKKLAAGGKYTLFVKPTTQNYVAFFNTTRPPLDNVLVRRALSYAMPYSGIIEAGAYGYGKQARGPVPKGIFPWSAKTPQYHQNIAKAKQLLAQAGHPGGHFSLTLTYASENQAEARFAPLVKDALAKIGVNLTIKGILFNQQWATAKANPQKAQDIFVVLYWPTYSDAGSDNLYSLFHSSAKPYFNLSYWKNSAYDKLVDTGTAVSGLSRAKAQAAYSKAMKLLYDQAPGAFLYDAQLVLLQPKSLSMAGAANVNYPFVTFFYAIQKKA